MKQARKKFANRQTVSSAVYDDETRELRQPRRRVRRELGTSFRAWARRALAGQSLSPKLSAILAPVNR